MLKIIQKILKKSWLYIIVVETIIIIILFKCGFRITYSPKLNNSWVAIGAVGQWAGVIATTILTIIIISQTYFLHKRQQQNENYNIDREMRITLFDKRFELYNVVSDYINIVSFCTFDYISNKFEKQKFITFNDIATKYECKKDKYFDIYSKLNFLYNDEIGNLFKTINSDIIQQLYYPVRKKGQIMILETISGEYIKIPKGFIIFEADTDMMMKRNNIMDKKILLMDMMANMIKFNTTTQNMNK